jgi:Arc/MetJ-type ribon-helix-helix transcriptional regulator
MIISIDPELERYIHNQVKAGHFASSAAVIEAGIARLMLDPLPDALDVQDAADIRESLEQIKRGQVISRAELHETLGKKYLVR